MKILKFIVLLCIAGFFFYNSCKKFDAIKIPLVQTDTINIINLDSVVFKAVIIDEGKKAITDHGFIWGKRFDLTADTNRLSLGAIARTGEYSASLKMMEGAYFYRAYISDSVTMVLGEIKKFKIEFPHIRKILFENFTGHKCGNSPAALETYMNIVNTYKKNVVPVSIHAGFYANPSGTSYISDYTTAEGTEIFDFFSGAAIPSGMVNRKVINSSVIVDKDGWTNAVTSLLNIPPDIDINISNNYNNSDKHLSVSIKTIFLTNQYTQLKLAVLLTEDSLASMQTDYRANPVDVANYVHRYVFRDAINGTWGEPLPGTSYAANDTITKTFQYWVNMNWAATHCRVVAFVYNPNSNEVIQAEEKLLMGGN